MSNSRDWCTSYLCQEIGCFCSNGSVKSCFNLLRSALSLSFVVTVPFSVPQASNSLEIAVVASCLGWGRGAAGLFSGLFSGLVLHCQVGTVSACLCHRRKRCLLAHLPPQPPLRCFFLSVKLMVGAGWFLCCPCPLLVFSHPWILGSWQWGSQYFCHSERW